jgi:hypothetical protein
MGVFHPDDMSGIILEAYVRKLQSKPINLEELIAPQKKPVDGAKKKANQALKHNNPSCHAPCVRTCRASRDRG